MRLFWIWDDRWPTSRALRIFHLITSTHGIIVNESSLSNKTFHFLGFFLSLVKADGVNFSQKKLHSGTELEDNKKTHLDFSLRQRT